MRRPARGLMVGMIVTLVLVGREARCAAPDASDASATRPLPLASAGDLSPESLARLAEAASKPSFPDWQRELMRHVAETGQAAAESRDGRGTQTAATPLTASSIDGVWTSEAQPSPRFGISVIYDPTHDRLLICGSGNEIWVLSLGSEVTWTKLFAGGAPPGVGTGESGVYDSRRNRLLIFGGDSSGVFSNNVWELTLGDTLTWTKLKVTGTRPLGRWRHATMYDPVRDRLLIFGGARDGFGELNDLWALPLEGSLVWTPITPAGTPPGTRYGPQAVYDPVRDRMLVLGGIGRVGAVLTMFNDAWAMPLSGPATWTELAPSGGPPPGRSDQCVIYDAIRDRVMMFAGNRVGISINDCWELALSPAPAWRQITFSGPVPELRTQAGATYDPLRNRMLVFGGFSGTTALNDVWALPLAGEPDWQVLRGPPHPRSGHSAVLDPVRNRMIVFGGMLSNDVWALSLVGRPVWTPLAPAGTPPIGRLNHAAIYDPIRDRMLVFGGAQGSNFDVTNELWSLSLGATPTWALLTPTGIAPSAREGHSAIYDPVRDRMLVFGGFDSAPRNDVWELSLAGIPHWNQILPLTDSPPLRFFHQAIYDPVRDRMLVFGGARDGNSPIYADVWALALAGDPGWQELTPGGTTMEGRWGHSAVYDATRDRMVVFAGVGPFGINYDTWELALADGGTWTPLSRAGTQPNLMYQQSAIYDPIRDRMVVFGGDGDNFATNELWTLDWTSSVGVIPGTGSADARLSPASPNPAQGPVSFTFTLPKPGLASLRLYDASGRLVRTLRNGSLPAGPQSVRWDGRLTSGAHAPAGVYFYELRFSGRSVTKRFVLLH